MQSLSLLNGYHTSHDLNAWLFQQQHQKQTSLNAKWEGTVEVTVEVLHLFLLPPLKLERDYKTFHLIFPPNSQSGKICASWPHWSAQESVSMWKVKTQIKQVFERNGPGPISVIQTFDCKHMLPTANENELVGAGSWGNKHSIHIKDITYIVSESRELLLLLWMWSCDWFISAWLVELFSLCDVQYLGQL